jgi:hypothetical protein
MSMRFSVYLGPFAEWLVSKNEYAKVREAWQALVVEFPMSDGCLVVDSGSGENEVVVGRKRFICECWTAYFGLVSARSPAPPRKFHWSGSDDAGVWEHPGFDTEEEKRWFLERFAQQLRQLAEVYGTEPSIKGGGWWQDTPDP